MEVEDNEDRFDIFLKKRTKKEKRKSMKIVSRAIGTLKDDIKELDLKYPKKTLPLTKKSKKLSTKLDSPKKTKKNKLKSFKVASIPTSSLKSGLMSYKHSSVVSKNPYHLRMETKEYQADYHRDNLCGSSYYGLATTIQRLLRNGELTKSISQVNSCIKARQRYSRAVRSSEPSDKNFHKDSHKEAIKILSDFKSKLEDLLSLESDVLHDLSVHFDKSINLFVIR
jgi:hypothetical protein